MTSTDKNLDWNGAPVIQTIYGNVWLRRSDGKYRHGVYRGGTFLYNEVKPAEELAPHDPKVVKLYPATTPEPPSVTWCKGGDTTPIREAWKPGRRAQVVTEAGTLTVTRDGEIGNYRHFDSLTLEEWLDYGSTSNVTVWLPEAPEVPEWAQDCSDWLTDCRLVATDDRRVWVPIADHGNNITRWTTRGGEEGYRTTDELADMDARLIVDRDGKAVL